MSEQGVRVRRGVTDPARRRYATAVLVGIITGCIGAIVKFGWEVPFPPRTPERNATNPPQAFAELFGVPPDITHATYEFSGNALPWFSFLMHFGFSIGFAVIYCVVAEQWPRIKLWQGVAYGLVVWVLWHWLLMPALGVVPPLWDQPLAEHGSELFGHAAWMWVIELTRRDLRNRITHEPDAEVPLTSPFR